MAQEAQTRVQQAVHKLLKDLDQTCVRRMQGDMHRCAAKCCDNESVSMEATHDCINNCSKKLTSVQTFIEKELTGYQNRIERCVLQCQDDIKDKITADTNQSQMTALTSTFEACVVKCADNHIELIPTMFKKMKDLIVKGKLSQELA